MVESLVFTDYNLTYTKGHKYYALADSYLLEDGDNDAAQIYFYDSNYSTSGYIMYGLVNKGKNKVNFYLDQPVWETTTTMLFRLDNDNAYSTTPSYIDSVALIDLTTTFGAGNEPDKDWCDRHINYFDGTTTIYK